MLDSMSANYTEWVGTTPAPSTIHRRFGRYKKKNECCDDSSRDCKSQWSDELNGIFVLNAGDAPVNVVLSATCILASVLYHVCLSPVGFFVTKKKSFNKKKPFLRRFFIADRFFTRFVLFFNFSFFHFVLFFARTRSFWCCESMACIEDQRSTTRRSRMVHDGETIYIKKTKIYYQST